MKLRHVKETVRKQHEAIKKQHKGAKSWNFYTSHCLPFKLP